MLERRDFLLAERGADRDREMASGIQHNAAALVARLQATGTSGVRAALGGSPVAYGSLRAAKCILTRRDCDVNSLTRRGTKSRSGQLRRGLHTTSSATCGLIRSYNQAAQVPSSNVTCKLPRRPLRKPRMVLALVSIVHSITSLPEEFRTAIEIASLCTSIPIYFTLSIEGAPF